MHNVGSIFRTSDGAGCVEKIYLCGITPAPIDRFGRKRRQIAKVSLGAEDSILWEKLGDEEYSEETWTERTTKQTLEVVNMLKESGFTVLAIEQHGQSILYNEYTTSDVGLNKTVIIVGHELDGIPEIILNRCDGILEIPMRGLKHSLNVSVAYGIILYSLVAK